MTNPCPFLLAGSMRTGSATSTIRSPYDGAVVGHAALATRTDVETAIDAAVASARTATEMPSHARATVLVRIADGLEDATGDRCESRRRRW